MSQDGPHVLISGAGLGGLTAAIGLVERGFRVSVFEQTKVLGEVGAGVQLSANGTRVLHEIGLADELASIGVEPEDKEIRMWNTGQSWKLVQLAGDSTANYGTPYYTVHRADLHDMLRAKFDTLSPGSLHLDAKTKGFEDRGDDVVLHIDGGESIVGDVLIGADGVHSVTRQALVGTSAPEFTGMMAWRGLIPAHLVPESMRSTRTVFWLGPNAHIIHFPVRNGDFVNFVGIVERDDWKVESWSTRGTVEECMSDFRGWHPDVLAAIASIETPFKWALVVHPPLERWSFNRVSLLGDAAHATLPFLAQGANMTLEDGLVLARSLEENAGDLPRGLRAYEAARLPRANWIVQASAEQTERVHAPILADPEAGIEHMERVWTERGVVAERYQKLYSYNAGTVPI